MQINYNLICEKYNINPYKVVIKKRGSRPNITAIELLELLDLYDSKVSDALKIDRRTVNKYVKEMLPHLDLRSFCSRTWNAWMLYESGYKLCKKCSVIKSLDEFYADSHRVDGKCTECKDCKKVRSKEHYRNNKEAAIDYARDYYLNNRDRLLERQKQYAQANKELAAYHSSNRRARKLLTTPPWADSNKIKAIYLNCPEGYQVDHIYPLQGVNSCGLHVENNLQYLTTQDNLRKSNKLPEEVPDITGIIPNLEILNNGKAN